MFVKTVGLDNCCKDGGIRGIKAGFSRLIWASFDLENDALKVGTYVNGFCIFSSFSPRQTRILVLYPFYRSPCPHALQIFFYTVYQFSSSVFRLWSPATYVSTGSASASLHITCRYHISALLPSHSLKFLLSNTPRQLLISSFHYVPGSLSSLLITCPYQYHLSFACSVYHTTTYTDIFILDLSLLWTHQGFIPTFVSAFFSSNHLSSPLILTTVSCFHHEGIWIFCVVTFKLPLASLLQNVLRWLLSCSSHQCNVICKDHYPGSRRFLFLYDLHPTKELSP